MTAGPHPGDRRPRASQAGLAWALLAALLTASAASGFAFLSGRWPDGSVTVHLQLGPSGPLSDGSASWGRSAESALAAWNEAIIRLQFGVVRDSTVARGDGDGVNHVFFANDLYGMAFDDTVVAVTTSWSRRSRRTEADVIFNGTRTWDSYKGPLKRGVMDFHRVALHEFGHVLGLDHPDEHGQTLAAIMNSHVSRLDRLTSDDIGGARELYGATPAPGGSGRVVVFPPRNESLNFREQLETKYRVGLHRSPVATWVDMEGAVVWTQEYLRYRVHQCTHAEAEDRVNAQIDGRPASAVCGSAREGHVQFPPRNEAVRFRMALESKYRDDLGRAAAASRVDREGEVVWTQEYLRYRVNGCGHGVAVQNVFVQIDGAAPPAVCR